MIGGRLLLIAFLVAVVYWAPQWMPVAAERPKAESTAADATAREERLLRDAERNRDALVVLSFVAIALALATRVNPWPVVPQELVYAPLAALLGCGIALRLVDFNFPVWNSILRGCAAPVISMAFITAYLELA